MLADTVTCCIHFHLTFTMYKLEMSVPVVVWTGSIYSTFSLHKFHKKTHTLEIRSFTCTVGLMHVCIPCFTFSNTSA